MKTNEYFSSYLTQFFLAREMFQTYIVEKIKTHFLFNNIFFFKNHAVYEIMWKNIVEPGTLQVMVWRMCIVCWLPNGTNTFSEYVILTDFPLKLWLHGCTSMLHYMYIACYVIFYCLQHEL